MTESRHWKMNRRGIGGLRRDIEDIKDGGNCYGDVCGGTLVWTQESH